MKAEINAKKFLPLNFFEKVEDLEKKGYISIRKHPKKDLWIYNYTKALQYDRKWCEITKMCRGLILDGAGNIVARPFPKFFNLGENEVSLPNEGFEVYEKMDGSLGILYWIDKVPYIATRGSFESSQAIAGTKILHKKYADIPYESGVTYLFEIIHPSTRVVVDYDGLEDLILIAKIDNKTGKDLSMRVKNAYRNFPIVKQYNDIVDYKSLSKINCKNREGFVIRFDCGLRIKIKFEEYVRIHRLLMKTSEKDIWRILYEGKDPYKLLDDVPDEFFKWFKSTVDNLNLRYKSILNQARENLMHSTIQNYINRNSPVDLRRHVAKYLLSKKYGNISFLILDGKDFRNAIWRLCKPIGGKK